ncbi:MAG: ferric reductase-like transmembrane domain-containing protein [Pikeienuella sp.]|uniref:ferric reductase-like transmembrane domain-containing protein n=1 Tax=Pikeienuella sp. TaxID=2831957 RepID=UPI00391A9868
MPRLRAALIWAAVAAAALVPLALAATSPLLAWREPVYIAAGFAGVAALALLLFQPLLARGYLPGLPAPRGRSLHRWVGAGIVAAVVAHVGGLWLTSPPDVIDALLLRSPTPFSLWGVIAMWAVIATALLALFRRKLRPALWRLAHLALAAVIVAGAAAHALLIEGTMETVSKVALSAFVLAVAAKAIVDLRPWVALTRRKT